MKIDAKALVAHAKNEVAFRQLNEVNELAWPAQRQMLEKTLAQAEIAAARASERRLSRHFTLFVSKFYPVSRSPLLKKIVTKVFRKIFSTSDERTASVTDSQLESIKVLRGLLTRIELLELRIARIDSQKES